MRIIWTKKAVRDLVDIGEYIALDNPVKARELIRKFVGRVKQAANFPQSGRVVPELRDRTIRELIEGHYRIVYKVQKNSISIIQVFEGHKRLATH